MSGHLHRNVLPGSAITVSSPKVTSGSLDEAIGELADRSGVASVDGRTGSVDLSGIYQAIMPTGEHITDPADGLTVDTQARNVIGAILDLLQAAGLMDPA
jgi:hypothetical protein